MNIFSGVLAILGNLNESENYEEGNYFEYVQNSSVVGKSSSND